MPAFIVLAAALAAPVPDGAPHIRWKLAAGDSFYATTVMDMKQTIGAGGRDQKQTQKQTTYHRYKVVAAAGKALVLEQTTLKSEVESNLPGAGDAADRLKGAVLKYTLDEKYKVTKVEGYGDFMEKASGGNAQVRQVLEGLISEETLKVGVNDLFSFTPGKPVAVGDAWTRDTAVSMGPIGDFAVAAKYKYDGAADGLEKISMRGEMTYAAPAADAAGLPFKVVKGELTGEKFEGVITFDATAGRLRSSRIVTKTSGTLTIGANGRQVEMSLAQQITMSSTITDTLPDAAAE